MCAALTAGTSAAHPRECTTKSTNMYQNQSVAAQRQKDKYFCKNAGLLFLHPKREWAIQHLLKNQGCTAAYRDNQTTVTAIARSLFHLASLEATFVKIKQSVLCRQNEFICAQHLVH